MKGGMGVPPMIAFSHGQDARATGIHPEANKSGFFCRDSFPWETVRAV
jgi:hypothetical protein